MGDESYAPSGGSPPGPATRAPGGEAVKVDLAARDGRGDLAGDLGRLALRLQKETDPHALLVQIVHDAIRMIPGAQHGSVSLVINRRDVSSEAASSELPFFVDALQMDLGQGPCLDAVFESRTVHAPDLRTEARWPRFAPAAVQLGAVSMLAFQLHVIGDNLGALNLYGDRPHAFTAESEHIGLRFATHAAVGFAETRLHDQLRLGMSTRDLIGQAKGLLMERYDVDADAAFRILVRYSRDSNRRLRDVAEDLMENRRLPATTMDEDTRKRRSAG